MTDAARSSANPKNDRAWSVEHTKCKDVAEVEIEREDYARIGASPLDDVDIRCALHAERADMHRFMTKPDEKIDGERREPRISEETHRSAAKRMKLVLGKSRGVSQCLANVFLFEIRQLGDDLGGRHAVGDEVDHVGHRYAKAADCGSARQYIRILGNPFERIFHLLIIRPTLKSAGFACRTILRCVF